jgi:hypothetical protein
VELTIVHYTRYMYGAHATTYLVNQYVNRRLGDYGPAVDELWIEFLHPPRSRPPKPDHLDREFWGKVDRSPRVTFHRARRRIDLRQVCRLIGPSAIVRDGHLTEKQLTLLVDEAADALELIRPRVKPDDDFDVERFLTDARKALARCPARLRKVIAQG